MRIQIKGGVWKNSEDEILKAAVMKYGLNNWSRVASLLVRKSAKQCKARWYEWLDPSVKKTEWTREEEEKLLHLAKLFPTQWRSIAPIVGRTAHQCLEHYEKLLDQAQGRDMNDKDKNDPRRLRPGEIDPHPETKPSRADAVDMDDDEKEMLSEARARLANTRGKKAKRKAREKQLEEARRLAALQKRRELKAAGINVGKIYRNKKHIDYANEIPFQQNPPVGFYEITADETPEGNLNFANISLQQLEGRRRDEELARHKKDDLRKLKRLQEDNLPKAMEIMEKMNQQNTFKKKTKLILPEPLLSENELSEIVRLGSETVDVISNIIGSDKGIESTKELIGYTSSTLRTPDLSSMYSPAPMRTPKLDNNILLEAQNAVARNTSETPLMGGENPELHVTTGFNATERNSIRTPNVLSSSLRRTPLRTPMTSRVGGLTPNIGSSVTSTPFRDDLSLNDASDFSGDQIGSKRARESMLRMQMRLSLANLPAPQNEIEVALPDNIDGKQLEVNEMEDENYYKNEVYENADMEEDMEDVIKRKVRLEEKKLEEEWKKQTQVIQLGLPRPYFTQKIKFTSTIIPTNNKSVEVLMQAENLLNQEMKALVENDNAAHPLKGVTVPANSVEPLPLYDLEELKEAKDMLSKCELDMLKNASNSIGFDPSDPSLISIWDEALKSFMYSPTVKQYLSVQQMSKSQRIDALKKQFEDAKNHLDYLNKRIKKLEKKYTILTTGYQSRSNVLAKKIEDAQNELTNLLGELNAFKTLYVQESVAAGKRKQELELLVKTEKNNHQRMQLKYADLQLMKDELLKCLEVNKEE